MSEGFRRYHGHGAPEPTEHLAVFSLGAAEYALDIMVIRQIIRPRPIRPVPRAPTFVEGVVELRGAVIPVVDLRRRFGVEPEVGPAAAKLIIVRLQGRLVALVVDRVIGVHRVKKTEIRGTPHWIAGPEAAVFSGVCRREEHLVLVIDLQQLLTTQETLHLGEVAPALMGGGSGPPDRSGSSTSPSASGTPATGTVATPGLSGNAATPGPSGTVATPGPSGTVATPGPSGTVATPGPSGTAATPDPHQTRPADGGRAPGGGRLPDEGRTPAPPPKEHDG